MPRNRESWSCPICSSSFKSLEAVNSHRNAKHRFECSECNGEFTTESARDQHSVTFHHWVQCPECILRFRTWEFANKHYDTVHGMVNCPECDRKFRTQELMNQHHSTAHRWVNCPECGLEFGTWEVMNQHYISEHSFECPMCDRVFTTQAGVDQHYEANHRTFECPECDCEFKTEEEMVRHYEAKHRLECSKCYEEFTTQAALCKHYSGAHGMVECPECSEFWMERAMEQHIDAKHRSKCPACGARFITRVMMGQHYNANHQFECIICSRYFTTEFGMKQHLQGYHWFPCTHCPQIFTTEFGVNQHREGCHWFPCTHCPQIFTTEGGRSEHYEMNHTFPCQKCTEKFTSAAELRLHEEDNHKAYPCPKCSEGFKTEAAMNQHISEDHKPFFKETVMCEHCLAPFTSLEDLKQHKIAFHSWKSTKSSELPPLEIRNARKMHDNALRATNAQSSEITGRKGKEAAAPPTDGEVNDRHYGGNRDTNTKAQSVVLQLGPSSSGLLNVEDLLIGSPSLEALTSSINQDENPLSASDDKSASFAERGLLISNGPTLTCLVEIDPQPRRDGAVYEIASDVWSPTMTISSIGADGPEGDSRADTSQSHSLEPENGSPLQKSQHITVPPRLPQVGKGDGHTLSYAIVAKNHSPNDPNVQTQDEPDGARLSPTDSEQYEEARSYFSNSTSDAGRDMKQGDISHDGDPLRTRISVGSPEVYCGCRICLSGATPTSNLTATHCGHLFCYECIAAEVLRTSRCPVCKNVLALYCLFKLDLAS